MIDQESAFADNPDELRNTTPPAIIYPYPIRHSCMEKLGIFSLGILIGAIALGVSAAVVESLDSTRSSFDAKSEDANTNWNIEVTTNSKT